MLAKRRDLKLNGEYVARTPLLIPSFSSKGFPNLDKIVEYCSELVEGATLVSAYDLHYKKISPPFDFPSLIFLDSGGYEASKDVELSDIGDKEHSPEPWTVEFHEEQLRQWRPSVPSVIISYDHPLERFPVSEQIERAKRMAPGRTDVMREILLKPSTKGQALIQIDEVLKNIHGLADFDVIGVTEKEIGNSTLNRMKNIASLRSALGKAGLETPIHIFGSLDTISTPLFFLAGADIFDGLTWLRFGYHEGLTIYKHSFAALKLGVDVKSKNVDWRMLNQNYYYLTEMELEMRRYLNNYDINVFKYHQELMQSALQNVIEDSGDSENGR